MKSFMFFRLYSLLTGSSLLILTEKAFAVVFPLTRHSTVIVMFSAYIVFFAKCYWLKVRYVRTRVKRILFAKKILRQTICEKLFCFTSLPYDRPHCIIGATIA
jgi:hypothetical protein